MTVAIGAAAVIGPKPSSEALRALSILEAKWYLRRASIWIGLAVTAFFATQVEDWSGGSYAIKVPLCFGPLAFGTYIAAVKSGARDHNGPLAELAPASPIGAKGRAIARLAGLLVPVGLSVLVVAVIAIVSRIEGGFWIGDLVGHVTYTARHSWIELLEPPLIVAFTGAVGVAAGRAARRLIPLLAGTFVWFFCYGVAWALNSPGLHVVAPMQYQPMRVPLSAGVNPLTAPASWLIDWANEYDPTSRMLVHLPTVAGHDIYLVGLIVLWCGIAIRADTGRRLAIFGVIISVVGVALQLIVNPYR